jgi:adenylate cyclase class 2
MWRCRCTGVMPSDAHGSESIKEMVAQANDPFSALARKGMLADPSDHFKGRFEVERKYAVRDLAEVTARLRDAGAIPFALGNRETDVFLDWPDGRLAAMGKQQVVRSMQPSGRVLWFVKGPQPDECIATDLEDFDKAVAMLAALGCIETDRVRKDRDIVFLGDFHVTLDRVPGLGDFVELAVMTDDETSLAGWSEKIEALAADFGLSANALQTRSYRAMLAEEA